MLPNNSHQHWIPIFLTNRPHPSLKNISVCLNFLNLGIYISLSINPKNVLKCHSTSLAIHWKALSHVGSNAQLRGIAFGAPRHHRRQRTLKIHLRSWKAARGVHGTREKTWKNAAIKVDQIGTLCTTSVGRPRKITPLCASISGSIKSILWSAMQDAKKH